MVTTAMSCTCAFAGLFEGRDVGAASCITIFSTALGTVTAHLVDVFVKAKNFLRE
jgi:hypothetical protein